MSLSATTKYVILFSETPFYFPLGTSDCQQKIILNLSILIKKNKPTLENELCAVKLALIFAKRFYSFHKNVLTTNIKLYAGNVRAYFCILAGMAKEWRISAWFEFCVLAVKSSKGVRLCNEKHSVSDIFC